MNTTVSKPVIPVAIRAVNVAKKTNIGQPVASHYKQFWVFAQNANILTLSWAENIEPINNMTMREPVMYKRSSMAWKWATKEAAWRVTETVYEGRIWTNQKKEPINTTVLMIVFTLKFTRYLEGLSFYPSFKAYFSINKYLVSLICPARA